MLIKKVFIIFILFSINACSFIYQDNPRSTYRDNVFILEKNKTISQSIITKQNNFKGIILLFSSPEKPTQIKISILDSIKHKILETQNITVKPFEQKYKTFFIKFKNLKIQKNSQLKIEIKNIGEYSLGIFYSSINPYKDGKSSINKDYDIYFKSIYSKNIFDVIREILNKFFVDKIFAYLYILIFIILCGLLLWLKSKKE